VVVFALLWLPIHLVLLVVYFYGPPLGQWFEAVYVACTGLAYFNSCVNPIIYNRTSKDFRDAFRTAVGCQKRVKFDSDAAATPLQAGRTAANAAAITVAIGHGPGGPNLAAEDADCADGKIRVEN